MAKSGLLDFTAVREAVSFVDVLEHYGLSPDKDPGDQFKIRCPFHDDQTPSCSINLTKGIFNCFGCTAEGNVLDFIRLKEEYGPKDTYKAALKALEIIGADPAEYRKGGQGPTKPKTARSGRKSSNKGETSAAAAKAALGQPEPVSEAADIQTELEPNLVLDLTLDVNPDHPFLAQRGVTPEIAQAYGIGHCSKGIMRGRIAIPIHNQDGELVAFAGRYAADEVPKDTIRYKLPKGFNKSLELWNLHRAKVLGKRFVVVVEGYWSTIRLDQAGIPTVALMGTSMSDFQATALAEAGFRYALVLLDGDEGGREAIPAVVSVLSHHLYVKTISLSDGVKPDTMPQELVDRLRR